MALYFISDLHLEEKRTDITRAFFRYLDELPGDCESLYILGDLFEVWIGDDDDAHFNRQIVEKLRTVTSSGIPVRIIVGNRDFLLGDRFCCDTGCTLLSDPTVIEYHEQRYLLMHGDSLCTGDQDYMAFRKQVRNPAWQQQLLNQSLEQRRALARQLREQSMAANSNKAVDIMDVTPQEVSSALADHQCLQLIHGHTHRPAEHNLTVAGQQAKRWVLGAWDKQGWQLRIDQQGPVLSAFSLQNS